MAEDQAKWTLDGITEGTQAVIRDVALERERQRSLGYDEAHDDRTHYTYLLRDRGVSLVEQPSGSGYLDRGNLIKGIAVLVATVEKMDRDQKRREQED